jgi:hypothetical protein
MVMKNGAGKCCSMASETALARFLIGMCKRLRQWYEREVVEYSEIDEAGTTHPTVMVVVVEYSKPHSLLATYPVTP